eukprot:CAMPEP_0113647192 /NCGR_PEP_ID=MMETSP0017_2-20120614/24971_1 /TAXON_ID=2856 /ORGANISM="Cylindrotheca closterium" /LENGTH=327 /DNA_ID=CAMNT_0000559215 /DNA_START=150 /DNA_END=1129 /DNA_ORIENTATION=+ /assembly_acc=CAM_ASM_000147
MTIKVSPFVRLPSGFSVNIFSEQGVQSFLETELSQTYISSDLKTIRTIRNDKNRTCTEEDLLYSLTAKIEFLPALADQTFFRDRVPESEIQVWLDFVIDELKALSTKPCWVRTGDLGADDMSSLNISAAMFKCHAVPVALAFESEYFYVLANFLKACPNRLPSTKIADQVTNIVSRAYFTAYLIFDHELASEKPFQKFEAAGILTEFIRCATIPQLDDDWQLSQSLLVACFDGLCACDQFLEAEFRRGQPCGDLVAAILRGEDGSKIKRPFILGQLQAIARHADARNNAADADAGIEFRSCNSCGESGNSEPFQGSLLKKCGRCRNV